ncbi:hypothetical protein [Paraburkholderia sp. GAS348]
MMTIPPRHSHAPLLLLALLLFTGLYLFVLPYVRVTGSRNVT